MDILVKMKFGSHLYGTDTPDSDIDYKGVYFPDEKDILLGRVKKSISFSTKVGDGKNSNEDVDEEYYSLQYFIELACQGQTVALDMLHAPDNMIITSSPMWRAIVREREKFYTRNLQAFIGYARKQASKYGIKGSRLNDAKKVVDYLASKDEYLKLGMVWDGLPTGEHIIIHPANDNGLREYEVCGRRIQETAKVGYAMDVFFKFYENYGKRAEQAAKNEGIDWKAISHALRAALQTEEILTQGTITFPLKKANYLRDVKTGKLSYKDEVAPYLEQLMDRVERLTKHSNLPMEVDQDYWDNQLVGIIKANLS